MNTLNDRVAAISALSDPVRKKLYEFVSSHDGPVSRDAAAEALEIPRHQAKFHLDRLEEAGLLKAAYARLSGRTGPGAGRPAKVYQRSGAEVSISLPQREYELAAGIMAGAIAKSMATGTPVADVLRDEAGEAGATLAEQIPDDSADPLEGASAALATMGYEPHTVDEHIEMINCPFHSLAQDYTDLVCTLNHELLGTFCACGGELEATLDPAEGRCCVTIARKKREAEQGA